PGHRSNILNPDFDTIGVGYYEYGWTQMFIQSR
ncbi:MAG: serine protease, partial [Bacillaceae bacterium]|nr:serine protease [Bacillaceae bacterium]